MMYDTNRDPVQPGDMAVVIRGKPWAIGQEVKAVEWVDEKKHRLIIDGLDRLPPEGYAFWDALPSSLLKISPRSGQFDKETSNPKKVAA